MLFADKRALETNLQVSLLKIREKELREPPRCAILAAGTCRTLQCKTAHRAALPRAAAEFYTQNCIAIGTQAALLSGFAYNGIIQVDIPSDSSDWLKTLYLTVTTAAMGFELIAVLNSTLCSMLGPGLALRGPDGSMHRAVDGLMLEYRLTFVFFSMGLVAFHLSALIFAWLEFSMPVALAMTMALLMFVYGMFRYAVRIYMRFALSTDRMVTGKFEFGDEPRGPAPDATDGPVRLRDGMNEMLSGGVTAAAPSRPADAAAQLAQKRSQDVDKIIGARPRRHSARNSRGTL